MFYYHGDHHELLILKQSPFISEQKSYLHNEKITIEIIEINTFKPNQFSNANHWYVAGILFLHYKCVP